MRLFGHKNDTPIKAEGISYAGKVHKQIKGQEMSAAYKQKNLATLARFLCLSPYYATLSGFQSRQGLRRDKMAKCVGKTLIWRYIEGSIFAS
jgi:hypothetical protein